MIESSILIRKLKKARFFININFFIENSLRIGFYILSGIILYVLLSKIFSIPLTIYLFLTLFSAPVISIILTLLRNNDLFNIAIYLDKKFSLSERLSTSVEYLQRKRPATLLSPIQLQDAIDTISRVDISILRKPRLSYFPALCSLSLLFLIILLIVPQVPRAEETHTLVEFEKKIERIKELAKQIEIRSQEPIRTEMNNITKILEKEPISDGVMKEIIIQLHSMKKELVQKISSEPHLTIDDKSIELLGNLFDEIDGLGMGFVSRDKKIDVIKTDNKDLLKTPENFLPAKFVDTRKTSGSSWGSEEFSTEKFVEENLEKLAGTVDVNVKKDVINILSRHNWNPRYDDVIKNYFSE